MSATRNKRASRGASEDGRSEAAAKPSDEMLRSAAASSPSHRSQGRRRAVGVGRTRFTPRRLQVRTRSGRQQASLREA